MKKIALILIAMVALSQGAIAQGWKELSDFHHFMSNTFHPAENGDYKPLREKADSLYMAAVTWQKSAIPAEYKEKETKETLDKLVNETKAIAEAIKKGIDDKALFTMINNAHDTFHKIVGECKKDSGHGDHDGHGH
jgi:hypothetical protein